MAEEVVKRPPGRPRRDAPVPTITRYAIRARLLPPTEEQRRLEEARASTFVLITTEPQDVYSDAAILEEYKLQTAVETWFRNLKSRPNIVDNIYVKPLRRAEALTYVFLLALIVAILEALRAWLDEQTLPKSALDKAMPYCQKQWPKLTAFLQDGRLALDNCRAERSIYWLESQVVVWIPEGGCSLEASGHDGFHGC